MSPEDVIGWDLGGAHLKAAHLDGRGRVLRVIQLPCPLWKGTEYLHRGVEQVVAELDCNSGRHAITMTGELVDCFSDRSEGVRSLIGVMAQRLPSERMQVFAGARGFLDPAAARDAEYMIASSNWLASALYVAGHLAEALFIDIGSTTTDLVLLADAEVRARGRDDNERLRHGELLYTGLTRTPLIAIARQAPFAGAWVPLMAEVFATSADVHRLNGDLPAHADQLPSADNGPKTETASARRLARMLGLDVEAAPPEQWRRLAGYFAEQQLRMIGNASALQLSRGLISEDAPLVGAGAGRFLVERLARRIGRPYVDLLDLIDTGRLAAGDPADCFPAVAVAGLAGMRP